MSIAVATAIPSVADLEGIDLAGLRTLAMGYCKSKAIKSSWIQHTNKADLVDWLAKASGQKSPAMGYKPGGVVADPVLDTPKPAIEIPAPAKTPESDFVKLMGQVVAQSAKDQIALMFAEEIAKLRSSTVIEIRNGSLPPIKMSGTHAMLPKVIDVLAAGEDGPAFPVWLVGPSGTGKTTLAAHAAKALTLKFACVSVCSQTTESALLGFMSATGQYIGTLFRDCWENGGLFCLDEVDAGNANVLLVLNSAAGNGICAFRDKMVEAHPDFRLIACANTWGMGADAQYSGRCKIDAATIDRFVRLEIGYDEKLEATMTDNQSWLKRVHKVRAAVNKLGIHAVVSPRAILKGAKLLKKGWNEVDVEMAALFGGLSVDSINKIRMEAK